MALFNVLPVLFTGLGLVLLMRLVAEVEPGYRVLAWVGALLVFAGGLAKATWKLLFVIMGLDLVWLANALFPLMAPGFALLAAALIGVASRLCGGDAGRRPVYLLWTLLALVLMAVLVRTFLLELTRGWFLPLLVLVSLANLTLSVTLIVSAWRLTRRGAAALFAVNLVMVFALPPIALASPDTLVMHWLEQSLTAIGTAAFALGAYLLLVGVRGDANARAPVTPVGATQAAEGEGSQSQSSVADRR